MLKNNNVLLDNKVVSEQIGILYDLIGLEIRPPENEIFLPREPKKDKIVIFSPMGIDEKILWQMIRKMFPVHFYQIDFRQIIYNQRSCENNYAFLAKIDTEAEKHKNKSVVKFLMRKKSTMISREKFLFDIVLKNKLRFIPDAVNQTRIAGTLVKDNTGRLKSIIIGQREIREFNNQRGYKVTSGLADDYGNHGDPREILTLEKKRLTYQRRHFLENYSKIIFIFGKRHRAISVLSSFMGKITSRPRYQEVPLQK